MAYWARTRYRRSRFRQRLQGLPRRPAHGHDLVFVGAAALRVDVLPEEFLDRIVCGRATRNGLLIGERRHCGEAGLGSGPDVDPVDGKAQTVLELAPERPRGDGDVVIGKRDSFHDGSPFWRKQARTMHGFCFRQASAIKLCRNRASAAPGSGPADVWSDHRPRLAPAACKRWRRLARVRRSYVAGSVNEIARTVTER